MFHQETFMAYIGLEIGPKGDHWLKWEVSLTD